MHDAAEYKHGLWVQKPVEEWGREEVQKWLIVLGMQRYEDKFRAIHGRVSFQAGLNKGGLLEAKRSISFVNFEEERDSCSRL